MKKAVELRVAEADKKDVGSGRVRLDTKTRSALEVEPGDIVDVQGRKKTAAVVWRLYQADEGKGMIRIDGVIRKNAEVSMGDKVLVSKAEVKPAAKIVLGPILPENQRLRFGPGFETFVGAKLKSRPVVVEDLIYIPQIALMGRALPFRIISTNPKGVVQIDESTEIIIQEEGAKEGEAPSTGISYDDIGGLDKELQRVREIIELPLKHPELFERLGIEPPKGVLLYGPPGTGKTLIAKAVANESGAHFYSIQGPEIISKYYGESEKHLRELFDEASKNAPSIVFIDELDSIATKREEVQGEVERRVVAQLLTLMDGLKGRGKVIVIAATNRVDAIDPALRRPGRFDREIEIGVPDADGRREILQVHTQGMPVEEGFDLERFVGLTHGFVGADMAALAREAAMNCLRRHLPDIDLEAPIPSEVLEVMKVMNDDFQHALKEIEPSSLRDVFVDIPTVKWDDIGGLDVVKMLLKEAVEMPIKNPEAFRRLGISPVKGVLLYGPPGTGKTLLAKAVANESNANFISIKGPEVLSKWVGDSEKAVREIFKKAKQAAPCIIFLDEIDALAPRRGLSADSHVTERLVNQLLTSMDGLERVEHILVLGATNRPEMLDPALLRSGRFDRLIMVPIPDRDTRLKILRVHTKSVPMKDVNLEALADQLDGFTGADIEGLVREAAMIALREDMATGSVTKTHFEEAKKVIKPSGGPDVVKYYEAVRKKIEGGMGKMSKEDSPAGYW